MPRQPSPRPVAAGPAPSRRRNPGRRLVGVIAAELLPSGVSYTLIPSTHGRPAPLPSGDCAGSSRTRITSAKTGLPLGLADADRSAGSPVVLDGIARYGWVSTHSGPHWRYNACTADGPSLVQNADDTVSLGRGGPEPDIWTVEPAADPGTYTIVGRGGCVTAGIPGRQVKVQECVAGDAAQQWRLSDIG
ncbi:RICIN domain-containing protein [Kitasatospora sp. NPDC048286]|uniref:RICIN domain-containing protein n=1 Tax=Kitasatospora sp. NPDC048286 TaxID=3364047 RepID=UPI003717CBD6